jgi:CDGSH-type Zn-finger protein
MKWLFTEMKPESMVTKKKSARAEQDDAKRIKVSKNGPYLVSGKVPVLRQTIVADSEGTAIEWREEAKFPLQEKCGLCRCGQSKNKPFCDGTHLKINFDGTETAGDEDYIDKPKEIHGPALTLIDIEEVCASARFCHRDGGIWNLMKDCDDPKIKQTIIEEARDCPSGRLVVFDKKTRKDIEPDIEKSIVAIEDPSVGVSGPLWVRGCIPVESADGKTYQIRNRVTLCRCGKSQNKPFCDSSHYPEEHEHGEE